MLEMSYAEENGIYFSYCQYFRNLVLIKLYNCYKEEDDVLFKYFDHSSGFYTLIFVWYDKTNNTYVAETYLAFMDV